MNYRTAFDIEQQKKWCGNCNEQSLSCKTIENYNAVPWPTPRTAYDTNLQNKWCSSCNGNKPNPPYGMVENFANSPKTRHDPDNIWSYTTSGCCK